MKYVIGGSTGLIKLVETVNRSTERQSSLDEQSLERRVNSMCWSNVNSHGEETEFAVGMDNGTVELYAYPSLEKMASFRMPSKCVHIHMIGNHFDTLGKSVYQKRASEHPGLYPDLTGSSLLSNAGRLLCCISQCGTCIIVDCDQLLQKMDAGSILVDGGDSVMSYKLRAPVSAVAYHSLMTNRIVIGGPDKPPMLFDLASGQVLWTGKLPHQSLLGLQSHLDVQSICFLEEIGPDIVAVSTSDSSIYIYDVTCQRKPVYDVNVCDGRSRCISARKLALHHIKEYNTERRKEIRQSVTENYSFESRNIVKLITKPHRMLEEGVYETKDVCDLFASDNVGTIYHLRVVTGDLLVNFIRKKICKYQAEPREISREQVIDHLIAARKRFGSASANDKPLHCAPRDANQYICELRACYTNHSGAIPDIACLGHYLISVGLDRYTSIFSVATRKRLFHLYCNQKQTCILASKSQMFQEYGMDEFKQLEVPSVKRARVAEGNNDMNGTEDDMNSEDNEGSFDNDMSTDDNEKSVDSDEDDMSSGIDDGSVDDLTDDDTADEDNGSGHTSDED
ncbi:hypothetical protein BaOVIS_020750 [Babesia ovis]|uniref:Uncharacterized protein n=1 Tax=Babesia ovis TaxID=5869 RepID=A0A9W5WV78_BABOV|nr:hypothetical protein BaOVIS_020750 [Babesia ovis]